MWRRDPIECLRELMGNPAFREKMAYSPERVYTDAEGKNRLFDEMWTGDWWWNLQVSIFARHIWLKLTSCVVLRNCSQVPQSPPSSFPPIKPNSRSFVATSRPGLYILPSETYPRKLAVSLRHMPQFLLATYLRQNWTCSLNRHTPSKATGSFITACVAFSTLSSRLAKTVSR